MIKKGIMLLGTIALIAACSFNQPDVPSWDTSWKLYLPLKNVNLEKIVNDSTLIADTTNGQPIVKFKLEDSTDWVRVNQEDLSIDGVDEDFSAKIGTIHLKDKSEVNSSPLTLNDLLPPEITATDTIPPYPGRVITPDPKEVTYDFYKSAYIKSGSIYLTFHNDLFLTVDSGLTIQLFNNGGDTPVKIADIKFDKPITPFSVVQSNVVDLSDTRISNKFLLKYTIPIQGTDTATVITDEMRNGTIYSVLTIENIEVTEAEAKIPEQSFSKDQQVPFAQDEHKIIKAGIASGTINLDIRNNSNVHTSLHIIIPNIVQNGEPKSIDLDMQPQAQSITPIDLSNCQILNPDAPDQPIDSLAIHVDATVSSNDQIVKISENDGLDIHVTSTSIYFEEIKGILAPIEQEITPETVDNSDMFKNISGKGLNLDDLRLTLEFDNQIDIPINVHLEITGYHEDGGQVDSVNMVIDRTIQASSVSPITQLVFDKNSTTPSIVDLMAILPTKVTFRGKATIEGEGSVRVNDGIRSKFLIESPLSYRLTDSIKFKADMDSIKKDDIGQDARDRIANDLSELSLHLNISNGTPISAEVKLILAADSTQMGNDDVPDSTKKMVIKANIEGGQVGADGFVQTPTENEVVIKISHEQAQLFELSPIYLQQTVTLLPTGDKKVIIRTNDQIRLDAYIGLKFRVNLK